MKLFTAITTLISFVILSGCGGSSSSVEEASRAASLSMGTMISNAKTSAILNSIELNEISVNESVDINKTTVNCSLINTTPVTGKNYGSLDVSGTVSGSSVSDISVELQMAFNKCIRTLSDSEFCGTGTGGDVTINGTINSTARASYSSGSVSISEMTIKGDIAYTGIFVLSNCTFDVTLDQSQLTEIQANHAIGSKGFGGTICGQTWEKLKTLLTSTDHNLMCVVPKTGTSSID